MSIRNFILLFSFLNVCLLFSQEPSYRIIGEDELSGIDIYSILEDDERTVWMTSNRGIIKYDGYKFKFLNTNHLKALSSFGIVAKENGEIFCFNLFGQVLQIVDDSVQVYYQFPDSLVFHYYGLELTDDQELYFRSTKNMLITNDKELKIVESPIPTLIDNQNYSYPLPLYRIRENRKSNEFYSPYIYSTYKWNGEKLIEKRFNHSNIPAHYISNLMYKDQAGEYISSIRIGGAYAFDSLGQPKYYGKQIYRDYYISAFLEDYEGNKWYTTLGKGIIIAKNEKILSYKSHLLLRNENIVISRYNEKGDLFIGSESGKVFCIYRNGEVEEVFSNGSINIYLLSFYKEFLLTNGGNTIEMVDMKSATSKSICQLSASKDIKKLRQNTFLLGTTSGMSIMKMSREQKLIPSESYNLGRTNSVYYNDIDHAYIGACVKGLFYFKDRKGIEIQFNSKKIVCTSLAGKGNVYYAATTTDGILIFENSKNIGIISKEDGLFSSRILKIILKNNRLFISTSEGLQIYNTKTNQFEFKQINNAIVGSRILDFDVYGNEIFVISNKDLQKFNINSLVKNETQPHLEISKILVNDIKSDNYQNNIFSYSENKFEFQFKAIAHSHFGKLKYYFRLIGTGDEWEETGFSENRIKYASLSPGVYTFELKAVNEDGVECEVIQYQFEIKPPFWETIWFYLLITLTTAGIVIIVWRIQLKRIQKKNTKEKELISSQLTALKLQMNPHFIFNALNSIQDLILKEDTDNSYDYIVKFSNLVRMTLNYSDKDLILLEEEAEMLKLYLELEDLRFTKDFEFTLENTIEEDVKIPSMLIQPFVENSVKHGLLHKEGKKTINIKFELNDVIHCTIVDNGIGIEKSKEINKRKHNKPESVSLKSIKKRVDILQEYYKSELGVEFINLTDKAGNASGTKVVIKIPFERE
jgi:hypothetical protein